ncbi:MAG: DUF4041 domain-containing protein [Planctomycetia bacterium]|nr:DUF4041 domain-containing protein [Planctomycetia bacterium]
MGIALLIMVILISVPTAIALGFWAQSERHRRKDVEAAAQRVQTRVGQLETEKAQLMQRLQQFHALLQDAGARNGQLQSDKQRLEEYVTRLTALAETLRAQHVRSDSERQQLERSLDQFTAMAEDFRCQNASLQAERERLEERFKPVLNIEAEATKARDELFALQDARGKLAAEYQQGRTLLQSLKQEVSILEENLEDISFGVYRPHFTFDCSEDYKRAIEGVRAKQKTMVRAGDAAVCSTTWQVSGCEREGERMTKQYLKLLLRAFNGEADAAVANVSWNNFKIMQARIRKAQEALNKLGTAMHMSIADNYCQLKLDELRLVFEHEEKKQQEREEQRRIRTQMHEEKRVQRELASAQEEAIREEVRFARELEKAREEAEAAIGAERDLLSQRVQELEQQLAKAHSNERAIAQAQITKAGHVYVISNIGSFGQEVFKIGMTRRLNPAERIQELGDASVPFPFDVHAIIYCQNAPELETAFHNQFWDRRINRANDRKEFFRITLDEIETFAGQRGLEAQFIRLAAAKEYRQTQAAMEDVDPSKADHGSCVATRGNEFPDELFSAK